MILYTLVDARHLETRDSLEDFNAMMKDVVQSIGILSGPIEAAKTTLRLTSRRFTEDVMTEGEHDALWADVGSKLGEYLMDTTRNGYLRVECDLFVIHFVLV